ncbi:MAG: hypothetical protein HQK49_19915 [Oligoflexia bacterium]|nr:hypothetical protein [Oligoflexia bacterium]
MSQIFINFSNDLKNKNTIKQYVDRMYNSIINQLRAEGGKSFSGHLNELANIKQITDQLVEEINDLKRNIDNKNPEKVKQDLKDLLTKIEEQKKKAYEYNLTLLDSDLIDKKEEFDKFNNESTELFLAFKRIQDTANKKIKEYNVKNINFNKELEEFNKDIDKLEENKIKLDDLKGELERKAKIIKNNEALALYVLKMHEKDISENYQEKVSTIDTYNNKFIPKIKNRQENVNLPELSNIKHSNNINKYKKNNEPEMKRTIYSTNLKSIPIETPELFYENEFTGLKIYTPISTPEPIKITTNKFNPNPNIDTINETINAPNLTPPKNSPGEISNPIDPKSLKEFDYSAKYSGHGLKTETKSLLTVAEEALADLKKSSPPNNPISQNRIKNLQKAIAILKNHPGVNNNLVKTVDGKIVYDYETYFENVIKINTNEFTTLDKEEIKKVGKTITKYINGRKPHLKPLTENDFNKKGKKGKRKSDL